MEQSQPESLPPRDVTPSTMYQNLMKEEERIQNAYSAGKNDNTEQAQADALNLLSHQIAWSRLEPWYGTETDPTINAAESIAEYAASDNALSEALNGKWGPAKQYFHQSAQKTLEAAGEEPDEYDIARANAFNNLADSI